ncbi:MAG: hypothetical protein ABFC63_05035 [Thermoguttaceae bacterium]
MPALPSADRQTLCCPRCGDEICAESHASPAETTATDFDATTAFESLLPETPPCYDDWEFGEQLRDIQRTLRPTSVSDEQLKSIAARESVRLDPPHLAIPDLHLPRFKKRTFRQPIFAAGGDVLNAAKWLVLGFGAVGFVFGGLLLTGSLLTGRQGLWNLGLSTALVGQVGLLVGLVLQLDRLWRDNREASAKLDQVDEQLHDLKKTTTLLGTAQGPGATTFYSHFAGGASPQLLLTDLKSQLDLLAIQMAKEQR